MTWNPVERTALVEALEASGPGRPTLCEGWRTEHLAAHVVLRETAPLAAIGVVLPTLHGRTERVTQALGDRSTDPEGWRRLLDQVRQGPPAWHPLRYAGDAGQLAEFFVHTEDVRRAGPGGDSVPARPRTAAHDDALWAAVARTSRFALRQSPVPLVLTDGTRAVRAGASDGRTVTVRGDAGELLLYVFDRPAVARVEVEGDAAAVDALARVRAR